MRVCRSLDLWGMCCYTGPANLSIASQWCKRYNTVSYQDDATGDISIRLRALFHAGTFVHGGNSINGNEEHPGSGMEDETMNRRSLVGMALMVVLATLLAACGQPQVEVEVVEVIVTATPGEGDESGDSMASGDDPAEDTTAQGRGSLEEPH